MGEEDLAEAAFSSVAIPNKNDYVAPMVQRKDASTNIAVLEADAGSSQGSVDYQTNSIQNRLASSCQRPALQNYSATAQDRHQTAISIDHYDYSSFAALNMGAELNDQFQQVPSTNTNRSSIRKKRHRKRNDPGLRAAMPFQDITSPQSAAPAMHSTLPSLSDVILGSEQLLPGQTSRVALQSTSKASSIINSFERLYEFGVDLGIMPEDQGLLTSLMRMKVNFASFPRRQDMACAGKGSENSESENEEEDSESERLSETVKSPEHSRLGAFYPSMRRHYGS